MEIQIIVAEDEQGLLLANGMNDHPGWATIADKIRKAREVDRNPDCWDTPRRPCQQCGSNGEDDPGCDECDDTGNIHVVLSDAAKAVIAGLVAPSDAVNHDGITAEDDVWAEIHAVFPLDLFTNRPHTVGYNPDASE